MASVGDYANLDSPTTVDDKLDIAAFELLGDFKFLDDNKEE